MFENEFHISILIAGHFRGRLNTIEQAELDVWLTASAANRAYFDTLADDELLAKKLKKFDMANRNLLWNKTIDKIDNDPEAADASVKLKFGIQRLWPRIAAAAIILITFSLVFSLYFRKNADQSASVYANDINPGKNAATLIMANGRRIFLDTASNGELAQEAGVLISKTANGQLVYTLKDVGGNAKPAYHILSTANGEQYQVVLPDKSKVWLNAASSIKFPATFAGLQERKVEISGEVYFEVAKDKKHPFIVKSKGQQVEVLGTHFNMNSYSDELSTKTTLFEGSVKVNSETVLKPGEQVTGLGEGLKVSPANTEEALAWKNGYFRFNDEDLKSIMRKIARWYDIEIIYKDYDGNEGFTGTISRSKNISQVLTMLEKTKGIHFKVEGRRVTVME